MITEMIEVMPDIHELVPQLSWRKFNALSPYFSVSFCFVFVGNGAIAAAEKSLASFPEFKRNQLLYRVAPREKNGTILDPELKVYLPALPVHEEDGRIYCVFPSLLFGESFCELQLKKGAGCAVCFRGKNHIFDELTGKYQVLPGGVFGWGLPHPFKPHFIPSDHYVWLVEHRPPKPLWPGFEPVWLKCTDYPSCAAHYYKLEIVWMRDSCMSAIVTIAKKKYEEVPEDLQDFVEFMIVRKT